MSVDLEKLSTAYWGVLAFLIPIVVAFCIYLPGIGVPTAIALVSAVIRVPLMRAKPRINPEMVLPQPLMLLLISWIFCLLFEIAATSVFCVVCFPLGLMAFSFQGEDAAIIFVFGLSGLIALAAYIFLFRLSLRMSR